MAVKFVFKINPGIITVSIPEIGFHRMVETVFSQSKTDIRSEIEIIKSLTVTLHREVQKQMPIRYLLLKSFDQFDYSIEFESVVMEEYLERLAITFQVHLRLRRISFNGRDFTIPLWRRNLEYWLRMGMVEVFPLGMMVGSFLLMPRIFRLNPLLFLAFLMVVAYLFRFLGKGLWILSLERVVPHGFVKSLLLAHRTRIDWFDRLILKLFWGSSYEKGGND